MELGLQFQEFLCCEETAAVTAAREESLETVIPEYCPAVARIVETTGKLCIREKMVGEERCTVSGTVKVTVLYTSEEAPGLRSLTVNVPFSCSLEDHTLCKCRCHRVTGRLLLAETSVVTSRKLYIKVLPEITVLPYREETRRVCCGAEEEPSVRCRTTSLSLPLLAAAAEKECSITCQGAPIGEQPPEDLLLYRTAPTIHSFQRLGNKLMVKGEMWLCALYRCEDRTLRRWEETIDFSQIVDVAELPEDGDYVLSAQLRESDVRILRSEGNASLGVSARLCLYICVYRCSTVDCITDLYSIRSDAVIERCGMTIPLRQPPRILYEEAQTQLEFDSPPTFTGLTEWDCSGVTVTAEERGQILRTTVHLHILYLDETGTAVCTTRSIEVTAATGECSAPILVQCGQPSIQSAGNVVRINIPVQFTVGCGDEKELRAITAVALNEMERSAAPSLILRRIAAGETLWDIAKQYRTDEEAIRSANHLKEGDVPRGLLLIPKMR